MEEGTPPPVLLGFAISLAVFDTGPAPAALDRGDTIRDAPPGLRSAVLTLPPGIGQSFTIPRGASTARTIHRSGLGSPQAGAT